MKCCNPFNRHHSKRKGGKIQRVAEEWIPWFKKVFPNFDWSGEKHLCTQCMFDCKKQADMLKIVAKGIEIAKKSSVAKQSERENEPEETNTPGLSTKSSFHTDDNTTSSTPVPPDDQSFCIDETESQQPSDVEDMERSDSSESSLKSISPEMGPPSLAPTSSFASLASFPQGTFSTISRETSEQTSTLVGMETGHRLNTTLEALNVTPLPASSSTRPYAIRKTYNKAQLSLKTQLKEFSNNEFPISPDPKSKPCVFCNMVFQELANRFDTLVNKNDKYRLLTSIPKRFTITDIKEKISTSMYMVKNASIYRNSEGAFYSPTYHYGHSLSQDIIELVKNFYLSSDNSKISPRMNDVIFVLDSDGRKREVQKQLILSNLNDLYNAFKEKYEQIQISESKFATLRPKQCSWPGRRGFHNTCVCELHQNFDFMLKALRIEDSLTTFIEKCICNPSTPECYNGLCVKCPNMSYLHGLYFEIVDEEEVEFMQWQHTDATDIKKVVMRVDEFGEEFESFVPKIIEHDYVYRSQRDFINKLRDITLRNRKAITIHVDFAQNYTFLVQNAVQGFHWSNRQATIHPFVVHWWSEENNATEFHTYCVISNEMQHDADTFHAFRVDVMAKITEDFNFLSLETAYYISDGAAGQYKNFKNFANLMHHEEDFGVRAEWHFTATAHGKSTCDAISGVVKSVTRRESLKPGKFITTAMQMYTFCCEKLTSPTLTIMYVDKAVVQERRQAIAARYTRYKTVPGTRRCHMFAPEQNIIRMKLTSSSETEVRYNFLLGETTKYSFSTIQVGVFYAFSYESNYQVGMIVETSEEEGDVLVQALKLNRRNGNMEYPVPFLFLNVPLRDVFSEVTDPSTNDGVVYHFAENEFDAIKAAYKTFRAASRRGK